MFALHKECLTRRYLLHLIQLLEGLLGLGLGRFGIFNSHRELGRLRLRVKLQTLMFFHEGLELLPHLANLGLILLPLGALRGRPLLVLDQRLLKGRHFRHGPYNSPDNPVILCNCTFLYIFKNKVFLTFIVLELLLGTPELLLGPLEVLL